MKKHYQRLILAYPRFFRYGLPPWLEFSIAMSKEVKILSMLLKQQHQTQNVQTRAPTDVPEEGTSYASASPSEPFEMSNYEDL